MKIGLMLVIAVISTKAACQSIDNQNGTSIQDTNSSSEAGYSQNTESYLDSQLEPIPYQEISIQNFSQNMNTSKDLLLPQISNIETTSRKSIGNNASVLNVSNEVRTSQDSNSSQDTNSQTETTFQKASVNNISVLIAPNEAKIPQDANSQDVILQITSPIETASQKTIVQNTSMLIVSNEVKTSQDSNSFQDKISQIETTLQKAAVNNISVLIALNEVKTSQDTNSQDMIPQITSPIETTSQETIVKNTSVLIVPNEVKTSQDTVINMVSKLKAPTKFNNNFSMDVLGLLSRTNRVSFVREVASSENNNFLQEFVGYLSRRGIVSFIEFDSKRMYRCLKCNVTDEQKAFLRFFTLNHIIFVIYDTCESLNKSISSEEWSIFMDSPRSFFVLVITIETIKGVDCSVQNFNDILKKLSKDLFASIWLKFQILEIVIYYPYICGLEIILKFNPVSEESVRLLSKEDLKNNPNILSESFNNLNGYPLKVKLFGRVPTSVKNMSQSILNSYLQKDIQRIGNVGGIDGFTLANLVKYLNFSVDVSEPADGIEYGYMNQDGIYFGTLGDVIYKRADISFNGRFLKDYNAKDIEFTTPIYHDQFCVLVPKALIIPTWRNIFLGFSVAAWYMIMLTASIAGVLWWIMKAASLDPEPGSRGALGFCVHFMDMCLLIASRPILLSSLGRERIFVAGCLIFNMIFSGVFQGYLNTAFSTTSHYPDINTLDSLDKSGLPIATSSRLNDIFGSGSLQKKIKSLKTAAIDQAAEKRDVAAVERRSDARLLIELKYLAKDGEPLLHVVNECPRSYYLTYIVYRGYPFLSHIDRFIQRIAEGGLNEQWYDFTMYSIVLHHRSNQNVSSESLKKLTFVDVQTAFFALAIGLVSSSVVFICEYIHFRIEEKRIRKKKGRWTRLLKPDLFYISTDLPKYQFTQ